MNILVYTIGSEMAGGGGRKVSNEITDSFNKLGHYAFSWSINPNNHFKIYNHQYKYHVFSYFNTHTSSEKITTSINREIVKYFREIVTQKGVELILFDTEYSYREYCKYIAPLIDDFQSDKFVLVHDQIWKWDNSILTRNVNDMEGKRIAKKCPYSRLSGYCECVKRESANLVKGNPKLISKIRSIPGSLKRLLLQNRTKKVYNEVIRDIQKVDAIFNLTPRTADESRIVYNLEPNKVGVAFGFLSDHTEFPQKVLKRRPDRNEKIILAFSRLSEEKNIEIIINSFALLAKNRQDVVLWIAGLVSKQKKEYYQFLRKLTKRLKIEERVIFFGSVSAEQLNEIYSKSDCFICAQICDFNLTVYDAIIHELPVILSAGYDFPNELRNSHAIKASNVTIEDYVQSLDVILDEGPRYSDQELEFVRGLTFENYAKKILSYTSIAT